MTQDHDALEQWLDAAIAGYSDVQPPPGFHVRTVARLCSIPRKRDLWPRLVIASAMAAVALVIVVVLQVRSEPGAPPPVFHAAVHVPALQRVAIPAEAVGLRKSSVRATLTHGKPIQPTPLTSEERALLEFSRTTRAREFAALQAPDSRLAPLQFKLLEIPQIVKEEGQ